MQKARQFVHSPFGSATLGGLVVAVIGLFAISTGLVEADSDAGTPGIAPAPLSQPAADQEAGEGLTVNEIYRRAASGVAFVSAEAEAEPSPVDPFGEPRGGTATGSAFVVDDDGHLLTNAHVVAGADEVQVTVGEDGEALDAEVIGRDVSTDLAVLEVESGELEPLPFGESSGVSVGDPVVAIGNPFGLAHTATAGIVSALQRQISAPNGFTISDVIQTDAPINPGNSGGPLIDASGRVIGINSQIESPNGGGNVGIGFAVPIDTAREVVDQLIATGNVDHAFIGISGADLTPEIADALNLSVEQGALVQNVVADSPADEAGIEAGSTDVTVGPQQLRAGGDVITAVDGEEATGMADVIAAINAKQPGDEVELTVVRKEEERTVTVELGERPANADQ
jgi:S1-C subfamily serine protease